MEQLHQKGVSDEVIAEVEQHRAVLVSSLRGLPPVRIIAGTKRVTAGKGKAVDPAVRGMHAEQPTAGTGRPSPTGMDLIRCTQLVARCKNEHYQGKLDHYVTGIPNTIRLIFLLPILALKAVRFFFIDDQTKPDYLQYLKHLIHMASEFDNKLLTLVWFINADFMRKFIGIVRYFLIKLWYIPRITNMTK